MCKLKDGERLDDLQTHGYEIIQHPGKFCFGMDAVLLASYAKVKRGERALDIGPRSAPWCLPQSRKQSGHCGPS